MTILYTHDVFTQQVFGGVSRYFVELVRRIRFLNSDSKVQVFGGFYINEYLGEISGVTGVKVPSFKNTGIFRRLINNIFQQMWIMKNAPDVIHQTYYSAFVFNRENRIVLTVPDMIHELYPESFFDYGVTSVKKRRCCERANQIIAISHSTKKDIVNILGIAPQRIQVIYLANPLENVKPNLGIKIPYSEYILYVGDRHGYKNFDGLIQAYAHSASIKKSFSLVCFGGGRFSSEEEKRIYELGISKDVVQLSGNDSLLALYYQNARALVYPSFYEGFGMPLLEAMSYSCPVICSNAASIPEVVGEAGVYFDPKNSENIRDALEKTLFDDLLLKDLEEKGIERNKRFSWKKCAEETLKVYQSLI